MVFYELVTLVDTVYPILTLKPLLNGLISLVPSFVPSATAGSYLYLKDSILVNLLDVTLLSILEYRTFVKHGLFLQTDNTPVLWFTAKVVLSICLLITIRGGVPRYRYDFLTKLGWVKFLTLVVTLFYLTFLLKIFY